jgi:hypothetical protein
MQYDDGKYMTEHKTSKAMSSKPLNRASNKTQSIMELANKRKKEPLVVIRRSSGDESRFMGC